MANPFGNTSSSDGRKSLFGQQSDSTGKTNQQTNVFGQNAQQSSSGNSTNLFGGASSNSLFGGSSTTPNMGASSPSVFAQNTGGSSSASFSFGALGDKKQGSNSQSSLFGGFATPSKTDPAQTQGTSIFDNASSQTPTSLSGTATPTASKPPLSFGNPSTTPAGPPPTNMFASLGQDQKNSASSIFGSGRTSSPTVEQGTEKSAVNPFGGQNPPASTQVASNSPFNSTASNPAPSLFGKPVEGNVQQASKEQPTFSFGLPGGSSQQQSTSASTTDGKSSDQPTSKSGFSFPSSSSANAPASEQGTSAPAEQGKSIAFGNTGPSASSLFGAAIQNKDSNDQSRQSSNLFGNLAQSKRPGEQPQQSSSLFKSMAPSSGKDTDTSTASSQEASVPSSTSALGTLGAASATAPATGGLFGRIGQSSQETSAARPADKPAETAAASTTLGASTAGPPPTPQSRLKNKSMDDIITRWASDLSKYQKEFQAQSEKVASWDRMLLENSNAISKLYSKTYQAERDTSEVQKQLSVVESHQDELAHWLDRYEREVDELMARQVGQGEGLQGPDQERERTYKIADRVSERLDEMGKDLTNMIEEINDASAIISKTSKPEDPLSQIVRVLNGHLSQLQIIDQGSAELQAKIAAAQGESQRLGSRAVGANGPGNSDVDHFYRSYMRRG